MTSSSKPAVNYATLKKEIELSKGHILSAEYDDSQPGNVPEEHRVKFRHIQWLGHQKFSEYCAQLSMLPTSGPWQHERKNVASIIFKRAAKCKDEKRNEDGWRESIEYRIFDRFDTEVIW